MVGISYTRFTMRKLLLLLSLSSSLMAQQTTAPAATATPELNHPPSVVYEQTMHPFEATRADIGNWSETEQAALAVSITTALHECQRLEASTAFEGEELFALARLCALGQRWPGAYSASVRYVRLVEGKPRPQHLVQGYYLLVQALLNLQRIKDAIETLDVLSKTLPLNAQSAAVFDMAIDGLSVPRLDFALKAAAIYQPLLLGCIASPCEGLSPVQAQIRAYTNLALLLYASKATEAEAGLRELDQAVTAHPSQLDPGDEYLTAMARRQYLALDKPFPSAQLLPRTGENSGNTLYAAEPAKANLYLFVPETCGGCKQLVKQAIDSRNNLNALASVRVALLHSPIPADPEVLKPLAPFAAALLPEEFLRQLGITSVPVIVVTDKQNRVRFISNVDTNWFAPKGRAEMVMDRIVGDQEDEDATVKPAAPPSQ